jgi:hypothetical protein
MTITDLYFVTTINKFVLPTSYNLDHSPLSTAPSGWTVIGSGVFTPDGYDTTTGGSYIERILGYDDILFDIAVSPLGSFGTNKVLDFTNSNGDVVSVWIDFSNKEIWISDVVDSPRSGFRAGIKDNVFFRLSVTGTGENFKARLYAARSNISDAILLQQTSGPSTTQDLANAGRIRIGNITGAGPLTINSIQINWIDVPDSLYPFVNVTGITPAGGDLQGGDRLRLSFEKPLDVGLGSDLLLYNLSTNDLSSGDASAVVAGGNVTMSIFSIGTAARKFLNTYSGDRPSGIHLSISLSGDSNIINTPPAQEVILGAFEYGVDGVTYTIQMVSSRVLGTVFRILQVDNGVTQLNQNVLVTKETDHVLEVLRGANIISLIVDGTQVLKSSVPNGPGVVKIYSTSSTVVNSVSKFSNFKAKPVLLIGNNVAALV